MKNICEQMLLFSLNYLVVWIKPASSILLNVTIEWRALQHAGLEDTWGPLEEYVTKLSGEEREYGITIQPPQATREALRAWCMDTFLGTSPHHYS
jgi:hypothetical protein